MTNNDIKKKIRQLEEGKTQLTDPIRIDFFNREIEKLRARLRVRKLGQ